MKNTTTKWTSRVGFIMTAAGAAVGLGNLQRFPHLVITHGGGAFLLLYLACVVVFAIPLMLAEFSLGRAMKSNAIEMFALAAPKKPYWRFLGIFSVFVAFCILGYYIISCSWTLTYVLKNVLKTAKGASYSSIMQDPASVWFYLAAFYAFIIIVTIKGLNHGVEKFSKIVMPMMFILQIILIIKILSIKGSWQGVLAYLKPDFTKLHKTSLFYALSQAFFSLCVGEAILTTYGSYASKSESLPMSAIYIAILDTLVAFLAGLIIFPAAYITNQDPSQGQSLIYNALFPIFNKMQGGSFFLISYFSILLIAGLTTCISLLDVVCNSFSSFAKISKKKGVTIVSFFAFLLGLPCLYSGGKSEFFTNITFLGQKGFLNIMDLVAGSLGMIVCSLFTTIFVGWIWGAKNASKELSINSPIFGRFKSIWELHIKWTSPLIIIYVLKTIVS